MRPPGTDRRRSKDFHFRSLQTEIKPLSFRIEPDGCELISANVKTADLRNTLAAIETKWKTIIPYRPFSYYFATPITWYFMASWLKDFYYRIGVQWWIFVLAGIAAFLIAWLTISFQAIKAALSNPVKSLRTE